MALGTKRPGGRGPTGAGGSIVQGLLLLGRGRAEGLAQFDTSVQGFLASLAPWVAFLLVGGLLNGLRGQILDGLTEIAFTLTMLLLPVVVSERLARLWGRDAEWLRFATVSMWCRWLFPAVYAAGLAVALLALSVGVSRLAAGGLVLGLVAAYLVWLNYFLARAALSLSRLKAVLLVLATAAAYVVLAGLDHVAGGAMQHLIGF